MDENGGKEREKKQNRWIEIREEKDGTDERDQEG